MRNLLIALIIVSIGIVVWRVLHPDAFRIVSSDDSTPPPVLTPQAMPYAQLLGERGFLSFPTECGPKKCHLGLRVVAQPVCHAGDLDIMDSALTGARRSEVRITLEDAGAFENGTAARTSPQPPLASQTLSPAEVRRRREGVDLNFDFVAGDSRRWALSICTDFSNTQRCANKPHPRVEITSVKTGRRAAAEQVFFLQPLFWLQPNAVLTLRRDQRRLEQSLPLVYRYLAGSNSGGARGEEERWLEGATGAASSVPLLPYRDRLLVILPYLDKVHCRAQKGILRK